MKTILTKDIPPFCVLTMVVESPVSRWSNKHSLVWFTSWLVSDMTHYIFHIRRRQQEIVWVVCVNTRKMGRAVRRHDVTYIFSCRIHRILFTAHWHQHQPVSWKALESFQVLGVFYSVTRLKRTFAWCILSSSSCSPSICRLSACWSDDLIPNVLCMLRGSAVTCHRSVAWH